MSKHHIKGQKDGTRGRYDAPHSGLFRETFGLWNRKERAERKAYSAGWQNARKQRK